MQVYVTPIEGAPTLNTASVFDPLVKADAAWRHLVDAHAPPFFETHMVGEGEERVSFTGGAAVSPSIDVRSSPTPDLVVVPGLADAVPPSLEANRRWVRWLARWYEDGAVVASSCTGSFLLAEAGLLSGRRATTHWVAAPYFRACYPDVDLLVDRIIVDEGNVITSGGSTTALNLIHYLVSRFGSPERAAAITRVLLLDSGRDSQLPFVVGGLVPDHADPVVASAQAHVAAVDGRATVAAVAHAVGVSTRTLSRRFRTAIDMNPQRYIELIRIERAKRLLTESGDAIDHIRSELGFGDSTAFRRAFRRHTGVTPSDYRNRLGDRFGLRDRS